ncbi:MAG: YlbF family regulator [Bacilli bacterium]|nr:YlbF family regulator [Bacilli bacterium]MDY5937389.1 YlbF family regulator [Bacilli bacterium]
MTELEKKASELASSFASLEVVNRYKRIKTLIAQDEYLSSLDNKITTLKKSIKGECLSHQETLKEIKALEKEKNEYPLIVSLKECEETIDSLVRRIQDLFII